MKKALIFLAGFFVGCVTVLHFEAEGQLIRENEEKEESWY